MSNKICVCCGKEYHVPKYRENKTKYCSRDCQNKGQYENIIKICICCEKEFKVSNSRINKKYCSSECRHYTNRTTIDRRRASKRASTISRGTATSATLRKYVFSIKQPICEICGYSEYSFNIDIHHYDKNAINNNIDNLLVLCVMCHRKLHKGVINYAPIKRQ